MEDIKEFCSEQSSRPSGVTSDPLWSNSETPYIDPQSKWFLKTLITYFCALYSGSRFYTVSQKKVAHHTLRNIFAQG